MSSSSTTAPPPAIGWKVHDSDRPRVTSGSVVMMSLACVFSISDRIILPLAAEIESGGDAGRDDVGRAGAALDEIVGQIHHFAEAVIHHREPAVGAEHAQPVRHVVQRGIELAGQRRFAEARRQRLDEDGMQAEVDALEADEEQHQQRGEADVVEVAMQRQRQRHRAASQQDVILDQLGPAVIAGRAAGGVADRRRRRRSCARPRRRCRKW